MSDRKFAGAVLILSPVTSISGGRAFSCIDISLYCDRHCTLTNEIMKSGDRKQRRERPPGTKPKGERSSATAGEQVYCTECGATLDNYCFSDGADDLGAIRKTLAQCKKKGKFSGDFCAKLFIAHPEAVMTPDRETGDDPGA